VDFVAKAVSGVEPYRARKFQLRVGGGSAHGATSGGLVVVTRLRCPEGNGLSVLYDVAIVSHTRCSLTSACSSLRASER
jgi:hypothetical protein